MDDLGLAARAVSGTGRLLSRWWDCCPLAVEAGRDHNAHAEFARAEGSRPSPGTSIGLHRHFWSCGLFCPFGFALRGFPLCGFLLRLALLRLARRRLRAGLTDYALLRALLRLFLLCSHWHVKRLLLRPGCATRTPKTSKNMSGLR